LGVSQPGLRRWLDRRQIATVLTPAGRREIPLSELVGLLEEVERKRGRDGARILSRVLYERERSIAEVDIASLLPAQLESSPHRRPDLVSLLYHRLLAQRLTDELVESSHCQLARWQRAGVIDPHWVSEWQAVLSRPTEEIAKTISADTPQLSQLRQSSPLAGLLGEPERRRILETVEEQLTV
jgi:hypothetical protein